MKTLAILMLVTSASSFAQSKYLGDLKFEVNGKAYRLCSYGQDDRYLSKVLCSKDQPYLYFTDEEMGFFSSKTGVTFDLNGKPTLQKCMNELVHDTFSCMTNPY